MNRRDVVLATMATGLCHTGARERHPYATGALVAALGAAAGMPACWGFSRPVILLPPEAGRWDARLRQAVLEHEAAHIQPITRGT